MRSPLTGSSNNNNNNNTTLFGNANNNPPSLSSQLGTTLPPPSSFSTSDHSKPVLPPLPSTARAPSPYDDHHHSALSLPPPSSQPTEQRQRSSTRTPPPQKSPSTETSSQSAGYRPLNVRDALTYLDQVKVRFSDQPDVYNRFLDIMKDFKSQVIDTPGVIERVSTLFKGHSMLISGFNTFLPPGYRIECSNDPHEPDLIRVTTPNGTTTTTGNPPSQPPLPPPSSSSIMASAPSTTSSQYMPMGRSSVAPPPPASPQSGKRSPVEFNHAINYVNKIKNRFANEPDTYKQFLEILQTYQKEQKPIQEVYAHVQYLFNGAPDLLDEFKQFLPDITGQPASVLFGEDHGPFYGENGMDSTPVTYGIHPTVSAEEVELFERIRKYIGNKPSYEEFLKTLNLYTQQIVDLDQLMEQVEVFIGSNKELLDWFKSVLGYESKEHPIRRPARTLAKPDLMHCATVADSPSYRLAPVDWQNQTCSGRDQLAWEVLNDVYVSHPIWASEDDGFVASKKSQYEEAMHRCEEERYDYNMNIEANLNTIALLEPISKKLETMTLEEKAAYRLYPGLGGQSVTIYERIIKKVYDKERGMEIIELLYNNPAQVVPILLRRLKQKDEEWKKAQREWNKIWRELDNKNYYRSLDYQGITFKGNDRKAMTVKAMVTEIEGLHKSKKLKQSQKNVSTKTHCQFMFEFPDKDVFKDVTRVVYSYIDRQAGFNSHDREKVRTFIRSFIPLCFNVDNVEPEGVSNYSDDNDDDELMDDDDDAQSTNTEDSESDVARSPSKREASPSRRRSRRGRNQEDDHTMDLKRTIYNFFCNTTFYAFFRLFEMIYGRLLKLKQLNEEYMKDPRHGKKTNQVALQLGLYSNKFDDISTSNGYYNAVLDLIDRFFDGEVEPQLFEESIRYFFVTDAYLLFTIDKLVHAFVKQIQAVTVDTDSVELVRLFRSDQELDVTSSRILSVYRLRAEEIVGSEENLYKINFDKKTDVMTIQLLDSDDYMLEPNKEDKYEDYISSYMDWVNPTEGVCISSMKPTYMKR
ncbi:uncharacterized protein BX664DRAFT_260824 [Halteromyces radiatus]|uniref:uncharacterized protein n=1 Tax=Halteromyces radiatus TaxID=101107 RepID=UPI00221ED8CD|nr:uncharacterized protein BX664DRAFT_260824 [Halteromyces radiatus]KAI8092967.1 hypothetical protein BX664DRAFT_260824 [Halteromyces radiatus]